MIITSKTTVTIDITKDKKGNFLTLVKQLVPNMDTIDSIANILPVDKLSGLVYDRRSLAPQTIPLKFRSSYDAQQLVIHRGKKFVLNFSLSSGNYEISENAFDPSQLTHLKLEVHCCNLNRMSV